MAQLLQALQDPKPEVRASVAAALVSNATEEGAKLPPAIAAALKQALPSLLSSLKHGGPQARLEVIVVLSVLGPAASSAAPALRGALSDENWLIRYSAAIALLKINPRETAVIPVFAEIFRDPLRSDLLEIDDSYAIHDEIVALGKMATPEAIATLISLLQVRDEKFRYTHYWEDGTDHPEAMRSLQKIGPRVIPALTAALKNENIRFLVADTLGNLGPQAIPPLKAIVQLQDNGEPALRDIFRDKNADLRRSAVYALGKVGQKSPAQKSVVTRILTRIMIDRAEPEGIRWLAAASLWKMGEGFGNFFLDHNLSKPENENCLPCNLNSYFDLYAARCLFAVRPPLGGGYELFKLVHDLMNKSSTPGSPAPQPQSAPAGR